MPSSEICLLRRNSCDRDRLRESSGAAQPSKRPYVDKTRIVRGLGRQVKGCVTSHTISKTGRLRLLNSYADPDNPDPPAPPEIILPGAASAR